MKKLKPFNEVIAKHGKKPTQLEVELMAYAYAREINGMRPASAKDIGAFIDALGLIETTLRKSKK